MQVRPSIESPDADNGAVIKAFAALEAALKPVRTEEYEPEQEAMLLLLQDTVIGRNGAREMLVSLLMERREMDKTQIADAIINRRFAEVGLENVDVKILDGLVRRFEEIRDFQRRISNPSAN